MAKHAIFVAHCIGCHAVNWWKVVAKTIVCLYGRYEIPQLLPFKNQFEIKPLNYNVEFDTLRESSDSAAIEVPALMKLGPSGASALQGLTAWAAHTPAS